MTIHGGALTVREKERWPQGGKFRGENKKGRCLSWQRPSNIALRILILGLFTNLLLRPLPGQGLLDAHLRARLQIVGVALDLLDDVFRLNFALEATQGALNALALLQSNFSQPNSPPNLAKDGHPVSVT